MLYRTDIIYMSMDSRVWLPECESQICHLISKLLKLSFPQFHPFWNVGNKYTVEIRWLNSTCCLFAKLCPTLCNPTDCSTAGFPVSLFLGVCSNSCPLSQWCYLIISSSVTLFSCPQSFPASGSFPMSQFFASGGQSIAASASASVLLCRILLRTMHNRE